MNEEKSGYDDEAMAELLRSAGEPAPIPSEDLAAIRAEAKSVWRARYVPQTRKRGTVWWILPLAATLSAAFLLAWWMAGRVSGPDPTVPLTAARVEAIRGPVSFLPGQTLVTGTEIETSDDAWLSLRLEGGQSLRLDEGSKVRLVKADLVELDRGGVYLDSANGSPVTFVTPAGDFVPRGTQFTLRVVGDSVQLRVREGRVIFHHDDPSEDEVALAGEELTAGKDGSLQRARIAPSDPAWNWILAAVQIPDIEGRTLKSFLDWITREKGLDLEFESSAAASLSREVILHGSASGMTPDQALDTVMLSSGFSHRISSGTLIVSPP